MLCTSIYGYESENEMQIIELRFRLKCAIWAIFATLKWKLLQISRSFRWLTYQVFLLRRSNILRADLRGRAGKSRLGHPVLRLRNTVGRQGRAVGHVRHSISRQRGAVSLLRVLRWRRNRSKRETDGQLLVSWSSKNAISERKATQRDGLTFKFFFSKAL